MSKTLTVIAIILTALFIYVGKAATDLNACIQPSRDIYGTLPWQYQAGKLKENEFNLKKQVLREELALCKAEIKETYYLPEYFSEILIYINTGGKGVVL